jgi:hypothetical protein
MVREQARKALHVLGWDAVSAAAMTLAHGGDTARLEAVLNGLAAFEAHPRVVGLLDWLTTLLRGDLRNRAIMLLERKRLGLDLFSAPLGPRQGRTPSASSVSRAATAPRPERVAGQVLGNPIA